MSRRFTVCALFYGDYPQLAHRLLSSLYRPVWLPDVEFRFGLNNVGEETRVAVHDFVRKVAPHTVTHITIGHEPYTKYPTMRRMFYGGEPLTTPYLMWFDDDSWIDTAAPDTWFQLVARAMGTSDMLGAIYWQATRASRKEFIQRQPWYAGRLIGHRIHFATGGWWTIHTDILKRHDWPIRELNHRGGDVLLGALCYQQGYRLQRFNGGVHINADDSGICSTSPRRGFDEKPLGISTCNMQQTD